MMASVGEARATSHLELQVTRAELERTVVAVIERCRDPVEQALRDVRVEPRNIDRVVFVG